MTVFEQKQTKIDFATTQAIKAKGLKRLFWVGRLRLAQWQMNCFMKRKSVLSAGRKI